MSKGSTKWTRDYIICWGGGFGTNLKGGGALNLLQNQKGCVVFVIVFHIWSCSFDICLKFNTKYMSRKGGGRICHQTWQALDLSQNEKEALHLLWVITKNAPPQ